MKRKKVFVACVVFSMMMLCSCDSAVGKLLGTADKETGKSSNIGNKDVVMQSASRYAGGKVKEKVGDFFVWTEKDKQTDRSTLYVSNGETSGKNMTAVQTAPKGYSVDENIVSNGKTIYFANLKDKRDKTNNTEGEIYQVSLPEAETDKANDEDGLNSEVKLEGEPEVLAKIDELNGFVGYYNGLIYFSRYNSEHPNTIDLYSCDPETGEEALVKENFDGEQYGQYILGAPIRHDPETEYILLDLETGEETELPRAAKMTMSEEYIIYLRDDEKQSIHRCDLSGENDNLLLELEEGASCYYFGRNYAQILYEDDTMQQLNYEDGSLEDIELSPNEIYEPVLEQYRDALRNDLYRDVLDDNEDDMGAIGEYINLELLSSARSEENLNIYYVFSDLNEDGRKELLIGAGSGADIRIYGMFTFEAGKPFSIFDISAFGYRSNLYIHEDGTFWVADSGGYNSGEITHYYLAEKTTSPTQTEAYGLDNGEEYYIDSEGEKTFTASGEYEEKIQEAMDGETMFPWAKIDAE